MSAQAAQIALGDRVILEDARFSVEPGEFIALLGPNGAGKTTLLRALLGLVPASGLTVLGRAPRRGDPRIGYMPQARTGAAGAALRGRDLIASAAGPRWGIGSSRGSGADIDAALDLVDARDLAERPLGALSGGQRQRLLLAQSLLGDPALLLLDEPLISLDPPSQHAVAAVAARMCRERGAAVLFSAHELTPLLGHVDRVLYLGQGHAAIGTVDEVVRSDVLSRLYGGEVEVVRAAGRLFVVPGEGAARDDAHGHHGHA